MYYSNSNHKTEIAVLHGVANVNTAVLLRACLVESSVSLPYIVSNNCGLEVAVLLNAPTSLWLVTIDIIKEGSVEDRIIIFHVLALFILLGVSEVTVEFEISELFLIKSTESFISLNLVLLVELH